MNKYVVSKTNILRLRCLQVIRLEFMSIDTEHSCDQVEVFHGSNCSGELLGTFSGTSLPNVIFSEGPLFIYFHTDFSRTRNGFEIRYTIVKPGKT